MVRSRPSTSANFTAPLAMMPVEMPPKQPGKPRLRHPEKFTSTSRLSRLEPSDPDQTVVLVVHGLMSPPATCFPMLNHLRADEHHPSNKKMIVTGHSMGGGISRLPITDRGTRLGDRMFTVPPERLDLTPKHRILKLHSSTTTSHPSRP